MPFRKITIPEPLIVGDAIGVAAPASPFNEEAFQKGLELMKSMGFVPIVPSDLVKAESFFSGSDRHRAEMIHRMVENPQIKAIISARGGYGTMRILPHLNFNLIRKHPKRFIGFSDITALLNAIYQKSGIVCYHGPVVTSLGGNTPKTIAVLKSCLLNSLPDHLKGRQEAVIQPGKTLGPLIGGNLTTLCHLIGTPHQPDFSGHILFLEDVGEKPYRIDRMLMQMFMSGSLRNVLGIVLGEFEGCGQYEEICQIFSQLTPFLTIPIMGGFTFGHGHNNFVVPIGMTALLDTENLLLNIG